MKWQGGRESKNVNDRRGSSGGRGLAIGGVGGVIVLILGLLFGGDPGELLNQIQSSNPGQETTTEFEETPEEAKLMSFVRVVLASTEDVWGSIFAQSGQSYPAPKLDVYREGIQTGGCGVGRSAYGPFYCPADQTIYLDLKFNQDLAEKIWGQR